MKLGFLPLRVALYVHLLFATSEFKDSLVFGGEGRELRESVFHFLPSTCVFDTWFSSPGACAPLPAALFLVRFLGTPLLCHFFLFPESPSTFIVP